MIQEKAKQTLYWLISCFLGVRVKRCQRCLTIRYTVQWENHMVGPKTKTISSGSTSHLQIPPSQPPKQQTETLIAPQCQPHATAPSPAPRLNLSLQRPSSRTPQCSRNQWCPRAPKAGWRTTGPLYLPSPGRAYLSPRPQNPETTPNSPSNTDCQQDLVSHSFPKTVRTTLFLLSGVIRMKWWLNMMMQTLCLSLVHPEVPKMGRSVKWD